MDWTQFANVAVGGIPLVAVVLGLVEWIKRMGLRGQPLQVVSLLIGLAVGIGYQLSQYTALPVAFGEWFAVIIYGLTLGLIASGIYDAFNKTPVVIELEPEPEQDDHPL